MDSSVRLALIARPHLDEDVVFSEVDYPNGGGYTVYGGDEAVG